MTDEVTWTWEVKESSCELHMQIVVSETLVTLEILGGCGVCESKCTAPGGCTVSSWRAWYRLPILWLLHWVTDEKGFQCSTCKRQVWWFP